MVQHCQTEIEIQYNMYKKRVQLDAYEIVSVLVRTFPAKQNQLIPSGVCRSNARYRSGSEWDVTLDVMRLLLFNLCFQVLLICQDVPIPLCDGLILTHPDLLSHLEERRSRLYSS